MDYVPFGDATFEAVTVRLLTSDEDSRAVAGACHARAREFGFAARLGRALADLDSEPTQWADLVYDQIAWCAVRSVALS